MFAAAKGHAEIVRYLLQRRADVNIRNRYACIALLSATPLVLMDGCYVGMVGPLS